MIQGKIIQVIGPTVDVRFNESEVPQLLNALNIDMPEKNIRIVLEVVQLIGNNTVRCISLSPTEGLERGMIVADTGKPIMVPVGDNTLGRIFNVL